MKCDLRYMRPKKAETITELHNCIKIIDELQIQEVQNGIIFPLKRENQTLLFGEGGCVDQDLNYIELSGMEKQLWGSYDFEEVMVSSKKVVYGGYLIRHWGHFLTEAITRLWYALENPDSYDEIVFFTEYGSEYTLQGNYKSFFELLGIEKKIRVINVPVQYQCVIVPEMAYRRDHCYNKAYIRILDAVREEARKLKSKNASKEKVFLSRSKFLRNKYSQEFGQDMLDDYFYKNGYQIIYPEELGLPDLINCFQDASVIASESGSCAHNILLAEPGKRIELFERQPYIDEMQTDIDVMKDCDVTYVDSYYAFYLTRDNGGPYLLYYSDWMKSFTMARNYEKPAARFLSQTYKQKALRWYISSYYYRHGYQILAEDTIGRFYPVFSEAIKESNQAFADYLKPAQPFILWYKLKRRIYMSFLPRKEQ